MTLGGSWRRHALHDLTQGGVPTGVLPTLETLAAEVWAGASVPCLETSAFVLTLDAAAGAFPAARVDEQPRAASGSAPSAEVGGGWEAGLALRGGWTLALVYRGEVRRVQFHGAPRAPYDSEVSDARLLALSHELELALGVVF